MGGLHRGDKRSRRRRPLLRQSAAWRPLDFEAAKGRLVAIDPRRSGAMVDRTRQAGAASERIGDGADRPHPRQPLFHAAPGSAAARRRQGANHLRNPGYSGPPICSAQPGRVFRAAIRELRGYAGGRTGLDRPGGSLRPSQRRRASRIRAIVAKSPPCAGLSRRRAGSAERKGSRHCDRRQRQLRQFRQYALVSERGSAAGRRRRGVDLRQYRRGREEPRQGVV